MLGQKYLYVYILLCSDDSYYIGVTNDVLKRVNEHNEGKDISAYTFHRCPVQLLYWEQSSDFNGAIVREKQFKGWTRKKKEALMAQNYELLHQLSKCKNETSHLRYGFGDGFKGI